MSKIICIAGGSFSGVGKGVVAASTGFLLKRVGFKICPIKFDGYLNQSIGTMNPYHKKLSTEFKNEELFVTKDGFEADTDIGVYERFLDQDLTNLNNITTGRLLSRITENERRGKYPPGEILQFKPHLAEEAERWVISISKGADISIIEIGGTVGDAENSYFIEAIRQIKLSGSNQVIFILVSPTPANSEGRQKTKPTRECVERLVSLGIQPDIIVCTVTENLQAQTRSVLSRFCSIPEKRIFSNIKCGTIYQVPLELNKQNIIECILNMFGLKYKKPNISDFSSHVSMILNPKNKINIAVVGNSWSCDSHISLMDALLNVSAYNNTKCHVSLTEEINIANLSVYDGIIITEVNDSIEKKMKVIKFSRENDVPLLAISFGAQLAAFEIAKHVCKINNVGIEDLGLAENNSVVIKAKPRIGELETLIIPKTRLYSIYKKGEINERHRHFSEISKIFVKKLESAGVKFSGVSKDDIVDAFELENHPFFIGTQYHPEYKSRPLKPNPLINAFIKAAILRASRVLS